MCREGQTKVPRAVIIADTKFPGDSEAFKIKQERGREEMWLRLAFNEINETVVKDAWEQVDGLEGDEETFNQWKRKMKEKERLRRAERKRQMDEEKMRESGIRADGIMARFNRGNAIGGSRINPVEL